MIKRSINGLLLLLAFLLVSCGDIFEEQIQDETISILAPPDNYTTSDYTVSFWWDELEPALQYRIQIVHPGFDSITVLVLDSIVTTNKLIIALDPGEYQWRVRGENGSSQTPYTVRNITVINSTLDEQEMNVISPLSTTWFSPSKVTFQWGRMPGATGYTFEIDTAGSSFSSPLFSESVGSSLSSTVVLKKNLADVLTAGSYQWRVNAFNGTSATPFSNPEPFFISSLAPGLLLPEPGFSSTGQQVKLTWEDLPGAETFEIQVLNPDGTSLSGFPTSNVTDHFFNVSRTAGIDTLLWRISAFDSEGNRSTLSEERMFIFE